MFALVREHCEFAAEIAHCSVSGDGRSDDDSKTTHDSDGNEGEDACRHEHVRALLDARGTGTSFPLDNRQ